jgi:hypothetical protein
MGGRYPLAGFHRAREKFLRKMISRRNKKNNYA